MTQKPDEPGRPADPGKSNEAPGHDPAGPGESENAPGHNKPEPDQGLPEEPEAEPKSA